MEGGGSKEREGLVASPEVATPTTADPRRRRFPRASWRNNNQPRRLLPSRTRSFIPTNPPNPQGGKGLTSPPCPAAEFHAERKRVLGRFYFPELFTYQPSMQSIDTDDITFMHNLLYLHCSNPTNGMRSLRGV